MPNGSIFITDSVGRVYGGESVSCADTMSVQIGSSGVDGSDAADRLGKPLFVPCCHFWGCAFDRLQSGKTQKATAFVTTIALTTDERGSGRNVKVKIPSQPET